MVASNANGMPGTRYGQPVTSRKTRTAAGCRRRSSCRGEAQTVSKSMTRATSSMPTPPTASIRLPPIPPRRAVEAPAGQPTDRDDEIGDGENLENCGTRRRSGRRLVPGQSRRRAQRDHCGHAADPATPACGAPSGDEQWPVRHRAGTISGYDGSVKPRLTCSVRASAMRRHLAARG